MSWQDPFVRAGVAVPACLPEKTGMYPAAFFRYRRPDPVSIEKQHKEFSACVGDPDKLIASMQKFVSAWIAEWNLDAPCVGQYVAMLSHPMLMRFYFIIVQSEPTAEIPKEFLGEGETGTAEGEQKKS